MLLSYKHLFVEKVVYNGFGACLTEAISLSTFAGTVSECTQQYLKLEIMMGAEERNADAVELTNEQNLLNRAASLVYYAYHYFLEWCAMNW